MSIFRNMLRVGGSCSYAVECKRDMKPPLCVDIEVATRIRDFWSVLASGAINRGRIPVERIQIHNPGQRVAIDIEDSHHVVNGLHYEPIPGTQTLVRWLDAKLVPSVRQALRPVVQRIKGKVQFRV